MCGFLFDERFVRTIVIDGAKGAVAGCAAVDDNHPNDW
jgi:hypothetical protein